MSKAVSANRVDKKELVYQLERITKRVIVCLAGILIARGNIQGFCPMAMAYFLAIYCDKRGRFFIFLSIILGLVTVQPLILVIKYVTAMTTITGVIGFLELNRVKLNSNKIIIIGTICITSISYLIAYTQGMGKNNLLMIGIESIIILLLAFIYRKSILYLFDDKEEFFSKEIIVSATIIVGSAVLGSFGMELFGISIVNFLGLSLLLIGGYKYGLEASVLFGVGIGIVVSSLGSGRLEEFILWVMIGVAAGIFRELGKFGALIGYSIATLLIFNIFAFGGITIELIESLVIAEALFLITPLERPNNKQVTVQKMDDIEVHSDISEIINNKLKQFATTYENIARVFNNIAERKISFSNEEVNQLMDDVAEKICKECSMCNICWEKEFYDTYRTVYSILSAIENKGEIQKSDIPSVFYKKCIRPNEFIIMTNRILELYKVNLKWENRIIESRELVAEQFTNISNSIQQLSTNINNNMKEDIILKKDLSKALLGKGYKVSQIEISYSENSKKNIIISFINDTIDGIKEITTIVADTCKMKVELIGDYGEGSNILVFTQKDQYRVGKGIARTIKSRENISGDNFTFLNLESGKDIIALSDGMGSGSKAFIESKASIELLEYLLEGGFDVDIAVKTVNSILGLKSDNQLFSTLDLSIIDRYTGKCTFIKNGAVASFVKRDNNEIDIIGNEALPLGIFKNVEYEPVTKNLRDGDIVIMMSDGILDSNIEQTEKENWLEETLKNTEIQNPQKLADYILEKAKDNTGNIINDDMTVIVLKVWKSYQN